MKPNINLNDLPRKNIYPVPDNYFDKLPNRIMQRVTATAEPKWQWLPALPPPLRMALASVLLLLAFVAVFFMVKPGQKPAAGYLMAALSQQEILDYLLTTDRLEVTDLSELAGTSQDLTHYFISARPDEIEATIDNRDIEEFYF